MVVGVGTGWPPPSAAPRTSVPMPPLNRRIGSAVPWMVRTGTGRTGSHGSGSSSPATGATAATRSAMAQATVEDIIAP